MPANRERGPAIRLEMEEDPETIWGIVSLTTIDDNDEIGEAFLRPYVGDVVAHWARTVARVARTDRASITTASAGNSERKWRPVLRALWRA